MAGKATFGVLAVIGLRINDSGQKRQFTIGKLAAETGYNEKTIRRSLKELASRGWITLTREDKFKPYTIEIPSLETIQELATTYKEQTKLLRNGQTVRGQIDRETDKLTEETDKLTEETDKLTEETDKLTGYKDYKDNSKDSKDYSAPTAPSEAPTPTSYQEWLELLRNPPNNNRTGVLGTAFTTLYPNLGEPDYSIIGRTANNVKAASVLLRLLWEVSPSNPQCVDCKDLMKYLQAVYKRQGSSRQQRKEPPPANNQKRADSDLKRQLKENKEKNQHE